MTAKASIPAGALAQNLLATIDASADPTRPPIHPDTLALYDLWLASGAANEPAAPPPPPASDDDEEDYSESDDDTGNEHDFGPLQSSFYGVTWDRKKGRWRAAVRLAKRLGYEGQVYNIGLFDHAWEKQAARAVDAFVRRYMPELVHSHLNFPDEPDEDDGQDSPADDAVPRKFVPNELERAADASAGPPPPPAPEVPPAAPPPPPADQMATASDSAMESAPAPMESDEDQDDESVPEVPGTTI
ncbi:unnamed protein product [Pelagomonas calceolata]|uniref:AP2/ERF domain-containing protein n=1 Tax=Pelagomonas calceolata TaxID=35677 RepID=A0A8J2WRW6_9STRA|nr:unnamed protein product [Pelagomonas calceolata]